MKNSVRHIIAIGLLLSLSWITACVLQAQQSGSATAAENLKFQPQLVTRTVRVINPPPRGSVTTVLKATELAPGASGQAKLKMGDVEVTVETQANGLPAPASFGAQFETYMVWAITPGAKAVKLGAMESKGNRYELDTKSALRSFAIIVTAEPYEEVTRPADTIVLEVPAGAQTTSASCEFLKDGYAPVGYQFPPVDTGAGYPPQIVQMYNARRIATLAGAETSDNFRMGDEWFNSVVFSAKQQKKFTDLILQQATSATQYFEAARMKALQQAMR
ncbi:MAG TPA: hypothetical protein VMS18_00190 [Candidatus Binatia bacterium]|nr:hypothetical protein [Candidatus Binatia bacterium]